MNMRKMGNTGVELSALGVWLHAAAHPGKWGH